jgi:hypothetical protein
MLWWIEPAIVYARHYAVKFKKPLLYAAAASALIGGGFAAGWTVNENRHAEIAQTLIKRELAVVHEAYAKRDEAERAAYVTDLASTRKLEAERDRLRTQNASLQERISLYVPQADSRTGAGYLANGAVRVFNDAASGDPVAATAATSAPSEEDRAASDVSWLDLSKYTVRISGQYNDVRLQCNALIDWVDTNVVNKPAP